MYFYLMCIFFIVEFKQWTILDQAEILLCKNKWILIIKNT